MQDAIIACPCCGQKAAVKRPLVDLTSNTASWEGGVTRLRPQAAEVMFVLARGFQRTVENDTIISAVYGAADEPRNAKKRIEICICEIRKKIRPIGLDIETRRLLGYSLVTFTQEVSHAA